MPGIINTKAKSRHKMPAPISDLKIISFFKVIGLTGYKLDLTF
ncbi:hypothetical protein ADICYQ_5197 [Cyclobacterium qasimii M12-11B]|uniref:Uncharacterized protein n=1 Tax=Cyclobacterium qasimii M12-11B TaxID=641524 RepID=S7WGF8_9BACT|nr:hypothetical protein ADICYQ_5197 [Cyclobacterium qasimii M12-11B]